MLLPNEEPSVDNPAPDNSGGTNPPPTTPTTTGSFAENLKNLVIGLVGQAADAGVLKLEVDPNNPQTPNTRLNPATGKIEYLNPVTGVWMPVTVVLTNNTGNIDLSKFSLPEIQGYLSSGAPIPKKPVVAAAPKKASASTEADTKPKTKWWVWALVAVGTGGFLYGVWRLAKRSAAKKQL